MEDMFELRVGKPAPTWKATAYVKGEDFKQLSSEEYKGTWQVLFFYPRDFTFICPTEIRAFAAARASFNAIGAELVAVSTDSEWSHKAWYERDLAEVDYPVLADTTHDISWAYGVLVEETGEALRGTFIIDPVGILRYMLVSDMSVGRSIEETMRVLKALQSGGLCPVNWNEGDDHLKPGN